MQYKVNDQSLLSIILHSNLFMSFSWQSQRVDYVTVTNRIGRIALLKRVNKIQHLNRKFRNHRLNSLLKAIQQLISRIFPYTHMLNSCLVKAESFTKISSCQISIEHFRM